MSVKVTGLNSLKKKLAALPGAVRRRVRAAMEKCADDIVILARQLVPKDSGALRDSIGWTWGDAPKGSMVLGNVRTKSEGEEVITVYAGNDEAYYVRWVEFGTAPHNAAQGGGTKAGKRRMAAGDGVQHPGTVAQPFFYPAYRANRKKTKARIARAARQAFKEIGAQK